MLKLKLFAYKLPADEDPHITSIGRWLRRKSFYELPQFINILRAEMSIVGPRPIVPAELDEGQVVIVEAWYNGIVASYRS